ncbi:sensor histidine kinase [Actinophytocola gossypii]|uniref:histidine kinase n=1 Tax=Actinophytocola gossypii TaxID=2812003 RepID=A0ABT2JH33_9PSEU|nr:HAMP domain-containing sensor histidine kinase [Actinophytocola gossypii]MCT2587192.1 HAMP domain-containing histidine kinase [Actinophytocola gossypii]
MLSRLTLRWRLTLLHTAVFVVAAAVVVVLVYLQNRVIIMNIDVSGEAGPMGSTGRATGREGEPTEAIAIQRNEALGSLLTQWIVALAAVTVLAGLLAWWVTGRVLTRVRRMTNQARGISTANLHERIALRGPGDELKELADTFDDLLTRLENAFDAQSRFIANASHELRTPLAVARTTLQVGLAGGDPERVARVRAELLRNNDRCVALIDGLLTLARGEQGAHRREPVDLADVLRGLTAEPDGDPRLRVDAPATCRVLGDPVLLAQLVGNLVDNATRYNVPGGEVLVELDTVGNLTVANTGPEVGEVDRLFEPFHRGVVRTGRTGAGLGLSIVRAIALAHGGAVDARPRPGGGLVVEVWIPPGDTPEWTRGPAEPVSTVDA